ncbi:MAG: MBL fold metallo-hydrolase [Spirochaetia bacterium]|jgi:7,8-dihydropterin-6-yl-methyl-4-(beta-D-ribofuranosyl)aminobenzene 5'-phosphate synthase|nr:MBL fold metallo-hydrolase [Spirochaetia bacterium]
MSELKGKTPYGELDELEVIVMCEDSVQYESPFLGQHGISLLARGISAGISRSILMDVGQNPDALLENFNVMNIDPAEIDSIVLTHCHYDHTQGLTEILKAIGKKDLPVIAHPSIFRLNFITSPYLRNVGVMMGDSKENLREAGGELFLTADPLQLMSGLFTTGEIKRVTDFEEVGISLSTIDEGHVKPDAMMDDISITACVKGKAPVILTGCSHAGIVNIVTQVSRMCGGGKRDFECVMGGFHLVEAPDERIKKTTEALKKFSIKSIYAGHCTGFRAQASLYSAFGPAFSPLQTGMTFKF